MTRYRVTVAAAVVALSLSACGGGGHEGHSAAADTPTGDMAGMNMPGMNMATTGDGLKARLGGYSLAAVKAPATAGKAGTLSFRIEGPGGTVQKDYTRQQTKLMHVYVVRKDLTQYQHVHPEIDPKTGVWSVPLTVPEPGPYHVVTEFEALTQDGEFADRILGDDVTVGGGAYSPATASPAPGTATVDGYALALEGTPGLHGDPVTLRITRDGAGVEDLQPYLASFAHITGFRVGDLSAVHVHPDEVPAPGDATAVGGPDLTLRPMFTEPGRYRLFIQFQTGGVVRLTPLDIEVS